MRHLRYQLSPALCSRAGVIIRAGITAHYTCPYAHNTNPCYQSFTAGITISGCPIVGGFAAVRGCAASSSFVAICGAVIPISAITTVIAAAAAENTAPSRLGPVSTMPEVLQSKTLLPLLVL
jgi:hypothetical protein